MWFPSPMGAVWRHSVLHPIVRHQKDYFQSDVVRTELLFGEGLPHFRWLKYWSFSFSIIPSNEYSGLISFRIDWFDQQLGLEVGLWGWGWGGQSYGTEPLICGIWCCLQADRVRIELNCKAHRWSLRITWMCEETPFPPLELISGSLITKLKSLSFIYRYNLGLPRWKW